MKRLLLLTFAALTFVMLQAAPISREKARQRAAAFVGQTAALARGAAGRRIAALQETTFAAGAERLYIFNIGKDEGFVVVSGDDRTEPILGYADSGTFDEEQLPDNARAWLEAYGEEIDALNLLPLTSYLLPLTSNLPIRPMLPTLWAQREPYNLFCPEGTPSGCVATAMAQVMCYYQWPQGETTAIPAYGQFESLPPTTFRWDLMLPGYGGNETQQQREAVAQLMQYCGRAVEMKYTTSTSTAFERLIPVAMHRYFGYDASVLKVERSDYRPLQWDSLIYSELAQGRPVILAGQKTSSGGHEFVCDGYDGQGLYHINWGWGGTSNGFYRLSVLNPTQVGTGAGTGRGGYALQQTAVIGIQPDRGNTSGITDRRLTVEDLRVMGPVQLTRTSLNNYFTASLRCWTGNHSTDTLYLKCGMALTDENGVLVKGTSVKQWSSSSYNPGAFIRPTTATNYAFGSGLTGHYLISVRSSTGNSGTNWKPAIGSDIHYIEVEMTDTTATLTERPIRHLAIDSVGYTVSEAGLQLTACVANHGEYYQGELVLMVSTNTTKPSYSSKAKTGVYLEPGESTTVDFSYKPSANGLQQYRIGYTERDTEWMAEGVIDYKAVAADPTAYTAWTPVGQLLTLHTDNDGCAQIPDTIVAVNLTNTTALRTLIPNNNPNTLYYLSETFNPLTSTHPNIIRANYADSIMLQDGHAFYCPATFTAGHIAYVRTFDQGYDGKGGGWQTIILPFNVQQVSIADTAADSNANILDWFRSPDDKARQFWLMDFSGSTPDSLAFRHTATFEANHPYLVAVPGPDYAELSLVGQPIAFTARSAIVRATALTTEHHDTYTLCGTYAPLQLPQAFMLNDTGTTFIHDNKSIMPFRAYYMY